jgi:hypothetical protein
MRPARASSNNWQLADELHAVPGRLSSEKMTRNLCNFKKKSSIRFRLTCKLNFYFNKNKDLLSPGKFMYRGHVSPWHDGYAE